MNVAIPHWRDLDEHWSDLGVSRETLDRVERYRGLLVQWAPRINLVGESTLPQFWVRHALDSLQLLRHAPAQSLRWLDVGSGAGLPGLILAAALAERPGASMDLVEPNQKRCAFLREAARAMDIQIRVHATKLEAVAPEAIDVVTARAVAPLDSLLEMLAPWIEKGAIAVLPKGREVHEEIDKASTRWRFGQRLHPSLSAPDSWVLVIEGAERV